MDSTDLNIKRAIRNIERTRRSSPFPWTPDEPHPQSYWSYSSDQKSWTTQSVAQDKKLLGRARGDSMAEKGIAKLAVYTWNIDFMLPLTSERMSAALDHLETLIFPASASVSAPPGPATPSIILLQELLATDLNLIQSVPWIQKYFNLTDLNTETWQSGYYGTATLIDKRLPLTSVFRVHYSQTNMERDGLFVDISFPQDPSRTLRICNTHLESLVFHPPLRPAQLATAAKFMHSPEATFSLLAGDLNAIQPFDRTLHTENSLNDAYLALEGTEDSEDGYTWGQMAQTHLREKFGCSRMDKVLYCGEGLVVRKLEHFGMDVVLQDKQQAQELMDQGLEKAWITDHLGLRCELEIIEA